MESIQLALSCMAAFAVQGAPIAAAPYGKGHINDTFRVQTENGDKQHLYLLQRINTNVFKNPSALMQNIVAVTEYLQKAIAKEGGDPIRETLTVIKTLDGQNMYTDNEGGVWRAYHFIEGPVSFQTATSPELLAASAKAFGRFARHLNGFPAADLHETIPHFHDTRRRFDAFVEALSNDTQNRAAACRPEIEFVLQRQNDCAVLMDLLGANELPLRVTHNDTKLNNVLIDPNTLQGVCVIDLDTVMPGLIHNDFGDAIRTGATTAAEDEEDLSKVNFSLPLYRAYADAYLEAVSGILTEKEKQTLPLGAKIITLECGIRFLTDYLQGDIYFKTHKPNHNLHRARTQFKLVLGMETLWEDMRLS